MATANEKVDSLKVEIVKAKDLIPYEFNNKLHDETQVNRIANSISEFGFTQPIVIDGENVIIIGHGRFLAAQKLGYKEVPCYRMTNLTKTQIKKLRILDNKTNESEWSLANLKRELDDIADADLSALFPELDAPELDPDDYEPDVDDDNELIEFTIEVTVETEQQRKELKSALKEMGYTKVKNA